ncbi:zinc transport system substrate-binding protein [Sulfurivirga caldicuralii]|uniref:High-affinity zinc uptake system protein ZnuA n=2 Tax=Sulfurivirga caldicuralii TaxID=364032 RepID=A0A1N6G1R2_9GAMM|nr:zinc transport system substrate-binding protein [Sulfurivirga caldicuralii]
MALPSWASHWVVSLPAVAHWVRPMLLPEDTLTVLLPPGQSPHHWALKPSQIRALAEADHIVLVAPALESPLYRWARAHQRPLLVWSALEGVKLLYGEGHHHDSEAEHGDAHGVDGDAPAEKDALHLNPHLWLSPQNGRALVRAVAAVQQTLHPQQRQAVQAREQAALAQLTQLDEQADAALKPLRDVPYMVLHDAFAYFDETYRLNKVGVIEPPASGIGLKRLLAMRERLQQANVRCVLYPAHKNPRLLRQLVRGLPVRTQAVDVLGWQHNALDDWFSSIVKGYVQCLSPS